MQYFTSNTTKTQAGMYKKVNSLTYMGDETDATNLSHENYTEIQINMKFK
jgi:hypothetical protein